ncbi:MAG: hypothetical protein H7Y18_14290 [Clostridiaceae bacterium]|nr:hypothetical protein [Clostridiaceae bacterium]
MVHVSHEIKAIVAQNCYGYTSRNPWGLANLGSISESCDSCSNFVKERCKKDLFNEVATTITIN